MKLEMTTNWLKLIQPGLYGTYLGDTFNSCEDEYLDDFKNQLCLETESIMNEIFLEDWFVNKFGACVVSNVTFHSPRYYNYENDRLDFDMEINEQKFFDYWNTFEPHDKNEFFKWTKKHYGSRNGFHSFFPYEQDKFEYALCTIQGNYDYEMAIAMLIMYAMENNQCDLESYQRDLEENMDEYCSSNGLLYEEYFED